MMHVRSISMRMLALVVLSLLAMPACASTSDTAAQPAMACDVGPLLKTYGTTEWLVRERAQVHLLAPALRSRGQIDCPAFHRQVVRTKPRPTGNPTPPAWETDSQNRALVNFMLRETGGEPDG